MQDLESLIKQTVHGLPDGQKELMYADLKNDFMETLLLPCTGCCIDTWEGSWTGTITFLGSILICIVFYILCLIWLFYAYVAVTNCGGPTLTASDSELCRALAECSIASMGAMGTLKSYFTFRLVMYCLSPLTLVSVAISSHFHQRNMLHKLTGLPHGPTETADMDDEETKCGKNAWLNFTTAVIFVMNVAMGIVTVTFDVLFLEHMSKSGSSDCTMILGNKQVGDSRFHLTPSIKETPIAVLVFNIIYTLWGFFYCGTMLFHFKTQNDNGSADLRMRLRDHSKQRPNYVSEEKWNSAQQQHMDAITLKEAKTLNAASAGSKQERRANSPRADRSDTNARGGRSATRGGRTDVRGGRSGSKRSRNDRSPGTEQPPRSVSLAPPARTWPPDTGPPAHASTRAPIDTRGLLQSATKAVTARHTMAAAAPEARAGSPSIRLARPRNDRYGPGHEGAAPPHNGP